MWRRGVAVGVLLAGVALVGWAGVAWYRQASPASGPATSPVTVSTPTPAPAPEAAVSARDETPLRVRVVRTGAVVLDAPVVPVGTDAAGRMAVPTDVRTVGWYRFGAVPGAAGSAVLAGHVDDRVQGRGAFHDLGGLRSGDTVDLDTAAGPRRFTVSSVSAVDKDALALEPLFRRDGPPVLRLVTCGGAFDRATGGYTENIVVTASAA